MSEATDSPTLEGFHRHPNGGGLVADTAYVADTAFVGPHAVVSDFAQVFDNAQVLDDAQVSGQVWLYDNAKAVGRARLSGARRLGGTSVAGERVIACNTNWLIGEAFLSSGNGRDTSEQRREFIRLQERDLHEAQPRQSFLRIRPRIRRNVRDV